jgi:hypothetical protein
LATTTLLQIVGHEALVADQQLSHAQPPGDRIAQEEGSGEVLDLPGRQRHRRLTVDPQGEP